MASGMFYVIDNFYNNPDNIRYHALLQPFYMNSWHPGLRTKCCFTREASKNITDIMGTKIYPTGDSYSFQFNMAKDVSWIHTDIGPEMLRETHKHWAGVIYLTPNAPVQAGTTLYCYKHLTNDSNEIISVLDIFKQKNTTYEAEVFFQNISNYGSDRSKWESQTTFGNIYNRCIIYPAEYFHESSTYFGNNVHDCRLIQVIFFYTKINDTSTDIIEYKVTENEDYHNLGL